MPILEAIPLAFVALLCIYGMIALTLGMAKVIARFCDELPEHPIETNIDPPTAARHLEMAEYKLNRMLKETGVRVEKAAKSLEAAENSVETQEKMKEARRQVTAAKISMAREFPLGTWIEQTKPKEDVLANRHIQVRSLCEENRKAVVNEQIKWQTDIFKCAVCELAQTWVLPQPRSNMKCVECGAQLPHFPYNPCKPFQAWCPGCQEYKTVPYAATECPKCQSRLR